MRHHHRALLAAAAGVGAVLAVPVALRLIDYAERKIGRWITVDEARVLISAAIAGERYASRPVDPFPETVYAPFDQDHGCLWPSGRNVGDDWTCPQCGRVWICRERTAAGSNSWEQVPPHLPPSGSVYA